MAKLLIWNWQIQDPTKMSIIARHTREIDSLFNSVTRCSTCRQPLGELLQAAGSLCTTTSRHHTIHRIGQRKKLQFLHLTLDEVFSPLHKNRAKNILLLKLFVKMNKYKLAYVFAKRPSGHVLL
jgi:hypothetical protein